MAHDPLAYEAAIDALNPGDAVSIFTPDTTHLDTTYPDTTDYRIALYAFRRGLHVLITKSSVKTLDEHNTLLTQSRKYRVFVFVVENHKRFDPAHADAISRAKGLGDFGYFHSYMSQPKSQLETFKAWAGETGDISYYLNSHHIDICASMIPDYIPKKVTASAAKGAAEELGCVEGTEDTITLLVEWEKRIIRQRWQRGCIQLA